MAIIGKSFEKLDGWLKSFSIEALAAVVRVEWIDDALRACGRETQRFRKLPAGLTAWLVVAMALHRGLSIVNTLQRIGELFGVGSLWGEAGMPTSAAIVNARDRLGFGPLRVLLVQFQEWLVQKYWDAMAWKGMLVLILDGTTFKVPDSEENRRRFGLPGSSRGGRAAFPQMRAIFLVSAKLRFVLRACFAPFRRGELSMAGKLLVAVPKRSMLLLDRLYLSWRFLHQVLQQGSHFVVRVKKRIRLKRRIRLGRGDYLVDAVIPRALRRTCPYLPTSIALREVTVRVRGRWHRFLTSLHDAGTYSAQEIVQLYSQRWEVEIGLDEVKTHQCAATTVNRPVIFRSKRTRRVLQEAFGLVIAYNAVRALIAQAAEQHAIDPLRISFVDSLERIRDTARLMAAAKTRDLPRIYQDLLTSIAGCSPPGRRHRRNPREVCIKMSAYPKKWKRGA